MCMSEAPESGGSHVPYVQACIKGWKDDIYE